MVSAEELNKRFEYKDGKLYRKYIEGGWKTSNTRYSGKEAGSLMKGGYRSVRWVDDGEKHNQLAHRVIYAMHHDTWPLVIDHIDRDPTNNKIENLRPADKRINSINRNKPANNTSGVRGVSWNKGTKRWHAYIKNNQLRYNLGHFDCLGQAIKARKDGERLYWNDV